MNYDSDVAVTVDAPVTKVWDALVNPVLVQQYMVGTRVESDYKVGSPIHWQYQMNGKPYEDSGKILVFEPNQKLGYSHVSGIAAHRIFIDLSRLNGRIVVRLVQTDNADNQDKKTGERFWKETLQGMKKIVERSGPRANA